MGLLAVIKVLALGVNEGLGDFFGPHSCQISCVDHDRGHFGPDRESLHFDCKLTYRLDLALADSMLLLIDAVKLYFALLSD